MKHTLEPWEVDQIATIDDQNAFVRTGDNRIHLVADSPPAPNSSQVNNDEWWDAEEKKCVEEVNANAQRIVDCVNACAGLNPKAVPRLLEALKTTRSMLSVWSIDPYKSPNTILGTLVPLLEQAISEAEGV